MNALRLCQHTVVSWFGPWLALGSSLGTIPSLPDTFWHIKSAKESTIVRSACEKARNVSS